MQSEQRIHHAESAMGGAITVGRLTNSILLVDIAAGVRNWDGGAHKEISPAVSNARAFCLAGPGFSCLEGATDGTRGGTKCGAAMLPPADGPVERSPIDRPASIPLAKLLLRQVWQMRLAY